MLINTKNGILPSKLKYKMLVSFCLMSLLPILAGVYIASLFIRFPFEVNTTNLMVVSLVSIFSMALSFLGYVVTRQMISPISTVAAAAQKIAAGEFVEEAGVETGVDELEELSRSLRLISKNAKELLAKVDKLSPRDRLTGLYNASYIRERLDEEIQRAIHYQRPCAFAYFSITRLDEIEARRGNEVVEKLLIAAAETFNQHMHEFDRAARISRNEFVAIFPDKNKKRSIEIIEAIGLGLADIFRKNGEPDPGLAVGVSENPLDGVQADALFIKAQDRMRTARSEKKLLEAFV